MLPYANPPIAAQLDPYEERERDALRPPAARLPAKAGALIALAICEVEAGLRSSLQPEQRCHLTLWPSCRRGCDARGGQRSRSGVWSEWSPKSTRRGWPRSRCWSAGAVGVVPVAMRLDGAKGRWELVESKY